MNNVFHKIIEEICNEENIKYTLLSKGWIIMLNYNNKTKFISGYKFGLNDHALGNIVDDKYAFYEIMKAKNIPIIEHKILFSSNNVNNYAKNSNQFENALAYFFYNNKKIVIKANQGTCGTGVFLINSKSELLKKTKLLFKKNFSISMCPYYEIKREYRVIVLNKKIKLIYYKTRPLVIGNGKMTIKELLLDFNYNYFNTKLYDDKYDVVLEEGNSFSHGWQFNLSQGSVATISYDKVINNKLKKLTMEIINSIDLNFGSIDIIETSNNEFLLMEANSGIMMDNFIIQIHNGYEIAKKIYKEAMLQMFK